MAKHRLLERLLLHGVLWTGVLLALDGGTSWIMMTVRGVASEANPAMRLLFQSTNSANLVKWIAQQWVYILLVAVSLLFYLAVKTSAGCKEPKWFIEGGVMPAGRIVALLTWLFVFVRLWYGPPGNVVSTLTPYGVVVSLVGGIATFVFPFWIILSDFQLDKVVRSVFPRGMISHDPTVRSLLDAIEIPDEATCETAYRLARDSTSHLEAAERLYRKGTYGESISMLQQAVETSTKSIGLLLGTLPNDPDMIEKRIGHHAARALLMDVDPLRANVANLKEVYRRMNSADRIPGRLGGRFRDFDKAVQNFGKDPLPELDTIANEAHEMAQLKDEDMWKPTLDLDRRNRWVDIALNGLAAKPIIGKTTRSAVSLTTSAFEVAGFVDRLDSLKFQFSGALGNAFPGALWLAVLLDWHFIPSRYSPIKASEHWTDEAYTPDAPLVKEAPRLLKYASRLSAGVFEASKVAKEYHTELKRN